ncbi:hypothetical protein ACX27_29120 [Nostoc piscinale CENA21]|uniref:Uncharacterized protein n=1 Tax=Nostoc piscinale CENA21 TaxID=224013 RepID=A0A0M3V6T3_9NOSO|nr:hypothetical protein [Nostoc piscinale]ALF55987.1 hypothetical protein ACX27_29120 [Nostoc piscinale CENA21]
MTEIIDLDSHRTDTESLIQEITLLQAETLSGGYCQPNEDYPYAYIINITKNQSKPKSKTQSADTFDYSGKKINTIDNSRKIYLNGVPLQGERNILIIH